MAEEMSIEEVRRRVGVALSDEEARALAAWYADIACGLAGFSAEALRGTEPPLRSIPGPPA